MQVPRLRTLKFETEIIERYRRRHSSVEEALVEMYLHACQRKHGQRTEPEDLWPYRGVAQLPYRRRARLRLPGRDLVAPDLVTRELIAPDLVAAELGGEVRADGHREMVE